MKEKDSNSKKRKQGNKLKIQLKKALLNYKRIKIYIYFSILLYFNFYNYFNDYKL